MYKGTFNEERRSKGFTTLELIVVMTVIAILAAVAIPYYSKYKLRGYKVELDYDTKNSYSAAQAYLITNPEGTVSTLAMLQSGGYRLSPSVAFVSANMTTASGSIVLKSTALEAAGSDNNATAFANGRFYLVASP